MNAYSLKAVDQMTATSAMCPKPCECKACSAHTLRALQGWAQAEHKGFMLDSQAVQQRLAAAAAQSTISQSAF